MSLGQKAAKGTLWVMSGTYIIQIVNFLSNILLMRLLVPEQFGVLALSVFFLTLGQKLSGFGFNHALIHRRDKLQQAVPTHQFLHIASSLVVLLLIAVAFPIIKSQYDLQTAAILLVLGISNIVQSGGHTPRILMEKNLSFAPVVKVNVITTIASNVLGIFLALQGAGVWALAGRLVIADLAATCGYFLVSKNGFKMIFDKEMIRWYFKFGSYLWLAGMATLVTLKFDDFLVGTMISAEQLGYYTRAYALACLPTTMVAHIVAKVSFPLYSKLQQNREKLSEAFENTMRTILVLTLPLAVGLAILAEEFVLMLFGEKWLPMVRMMQLLLIYSSLRPMFDNTGELFTAIGKPKIAGVILLIQAGAVFVLCPAMIWYWQAPGAAIAVGLVMALGVFCAYYLLPRYVNISVKGLFAGPLISAAIGAGIVWLAVSLVYPETMVGRFFFKGIVFSAGFLAALFAIEGRRLVSDLKKLRKIFNSNENG